MQGSWATTYFVLASGLMGLGIALDVAVATLGRFRDSSMNFKSWTFPITLTHIGFPALGYYGWWLLGKEFAGLSVVLGVGAFLLIAVFLYEMFCGWIDAKPQVSLEPLTRHFLGLFDEANHGRWLAILAVSMDALWSGPAKAAQARSGAWSDHEVMISFLVAGLVVAVVAQTSLLAAKLLNRLKFVELESLCRKLVIAKIIELVVLGGFAILSLWNGFSVLLGLGDLATSIIISGVISLTVSAIFWNRLMRVQRAELVENGFLENDAAD